MKCLTFRTAFILFFLFVITIGVSSFKHTPGNSVILVYGIAYGDQCGGESALGYFTYLISEVDYTSSIRKNLEENFRKNYPRAERVQIGTSSFEYGKDASNVCIIYWYKETGHCKLTFYTIKFGKTQAEALDRAVSQAKSAGGSTVEWSLAEQKYW